MPVRIEDELNEEEQLELAQATELADVEGKANEEEERSEEQLPASVRRYTEVVQAVQALVAGRAVDFDALVDLTDEERSALEGLAELLVGTHGTRFLYAEDRLRALNHTLAVLQPALAVAMHGTGIDVLRQSFEGVVDQINDLRDRLQSLEDAEDLQIEREAYKKKSDEDDDGDDDADDGDDGEDDDAPAAEDDDGDGAKKQPDDEEPPAPAAEA